MDSKSSGAPRIIHQTGQGRRHERAGVRTQASPQQRQNREACAARLNPQTHQHMKPKPLILVASILLGAWLLTDHSQADPRRQREVVILQAQQDSIQVGDGLGHYAWTWDQLVVVRGNSSSNAPTFPTFIFGDAVKVTGQTNTVVPLAQALADLLSQGYRIETSGGVPFTYLLVK